MERECLENMTVSTENVTPMRLLSFSCVEHDSGEQLNQGLYCKYISNS